MTRILVLSGTNHNFAPSADIIHDFLAAESGLAVTLSTDPEILASPELDEMDACVFGSGFTRSESQADGSVRRVANLTPAQEEGLLGFVAGGKGLVGIHGTGWWIGGLAVDLLGGHSNWHPPGLTFTVDIADSAHPATRGIGNFEVEDEIYISAYDPAIHILASAQWHGQAHPMAWVKPYGRGRVFYTTLGHGPQTFTRPAMQRLIVQGTVWAAGEQRANNEERMRKNSDTWRMETVAIHAGKEIDPTTGAVMPPLHLSTTYERKADGSYHDGFAYIRSDNPTRRSLEDALCALEGGVCTVTFASGMAAIMSVFQALRPGDHVLIPDDIYFGTKVMIDKLFTPWGLSSQAVDMTDLDGVRAAIRPNTRMLWIETPSNPLLKITDIAATAEIAHAAGAILACDSTWPSPVLQQTLAQGADLAIHATTKYLGGHSDLLGGAVIARQNTPFFDSIRVIQQTGGAVPSPFDCWLLLRGIRTLPYRMRGHCENAQRVAEYLSRHPKIEKVYYPGLPDHPGHTIAARQMSGFGGMLSLQVCEDKLHPGEQNARRMANRTQLFVQATSLGGVESLIEHRASIEGDVTNAPANLLRLSVGLEHPDDLIADLEQALTDEVTLER